MRMGRYYVMSDEDAREFGDAVLGIGAVAQALPLNALKVWLTDQRRILTGGVLPTGGMSDLRELDQIMLVVVQAEHLAQATEHLARLRREIETERAEAEIERAAASAPEPEPAIPEDWR